jgi:hypothetical protein
MATLSAKDRKNLPRYDFGLPEKGAYPMPDENHARLALSGASRAYSVGNISATEKERVDRKAHAILKRGEK